jgi:hypothetical protein
LALLLAVVAVLAGCAGPGSSVGGVGGPGSRGPGNNEALAPLGFDCDTGPHPSGSKPVFTPLPADAVLVSATRCLFDLRPVAGDGEWIFRIEQRADSGLDALATALRLPWYVGGPGGYACAVGDYFPMVITVADTKGRQIHPELPHGVCDGPLPAAVDAIRALPWHTTAEEKFQRSRTELETSSGCASGYKPVVALLGSELNPGNPNRTTIDTSVSPLRVCRYKPGTSPDDEVTVTGETIVHVGHLVGASTLDAARSRELHTAIATAPVATEVCNQDEPFAVVGPTNQASLVTVETGGCYRALVDGENVVRQLDAETINQIFS